MINPRFGEVKITMMREASEAACVKLTKGNKDELTVYMVW